MIRFKLSYFECIMQRPISLEKSIQKGREGKGQFQKNNKINYLAETRNEKQYQIITKQWEEQILTASILIAQQLRR